jgi:hypothetical protein
LNGSIVDLPFTDRAVQSLSCLHVIEHIGLGRYGDPIDPQGPERTGREIARVLTAEGAPTFRRRWAGRACSSTASAYSGLPK